MPQKKHRKEIPKKIDIPIINTLIPEPVIPLKIYHFFALLTVDFNL